MNKMGLVIGTGPTLHYDLVQWYKNQLNSILPFETYALNRAGCFYTPRIDIWATHHPLELPVWCKARRMIQGNSDFETYSTLPTSFVDHVFQVEAPYGSSALLATMVALEERNCLGVIVLGCPLNCSEYSEFQFGWLHRRFFLKDKVRAFSGFLYDKFGTPKPSWVKGVKEDA